MVHGPRLSFAGKHPICFLYFVELLEEVFKKTYQAQKGKTKLITVVSKQIPIIQTSVVFTFYCFLANKKMVQRSRLPADLVSQD